MPTINVLKNFSKKPGGRLRTDGRFSGEEFREVWLEPHFVDPNNKSKVVIVLDGAEGYSTSFLEEAFGGLARKFGVQRCLEKLQFVSKGDNLLIKEIKNHIASATERK